MNDTKLRHELADYLIKGHARAPLSEAIKDFPVEFMNKRLESLPYTAWQLLEHIRITQWDMIDFVKNPSYKEMEWPKDYWPTTEADQQMWNKSFEQYEKDLLIFKDIVQDPKTDLIAPIPWGTGQTVLKEVLQIIDHASYHTGELILLRRMFGIWKK